ncbi:MAG: hypothetical protein EPO11_06435, partial [Gammaproteobacteria bacterium]
MLNRIVKIENPQEAITLKNALDAGKYPQDTEINIINAEAESGIVYISQAIRAGKAPKGLHIKIPSRLAGLEWVAGEIAYAIKSENCPENLCVTFEGTLQNEGFEILMNAVKERKDVRNLKLDFYISKSNRSCLRDKDEFASILKSMNDMVGGLRLHIRYCYSLDYPPHISRYEYNVHLDFIRDAMYDNYAVTECTFDFHTICRDYPDMEADYSSPWKDYLKSIKQSCERNQLLLNLERQKKQRRFDQQRQIRQLLTAYPQHAIFIDRLCKGYGINFNIQAHASNLVSPPSLEQINTKLAVAPFYPRLLNDEVIKFPWILE